MELKFKYFALVSSAGDVNTAKKTISNISVPAKDRIHSATRYFIVRF